jgi:hypothetical protein
MRDDDEDGIDSVDLAELPGPPRIGLGLPVIALILPVVAGSILLFNTSFVSALAISGATVVVSSLLLAIDAGRLGKFDLKGKRRESAPLLFVGMCALWIVVYPLVFFRRRHFCGPNLGVPAILVALFFGGGPIARALLIQGGLPACDSPEAVRLFEQALRSTQQGAEARSIDGHRELAYDRRAERRQCQCLVHIDGGEIVVDYVVQWRDRDNSLFEIRIPPQLPSCASREVVEVLDRAIRGTPAGAKAQSIDHHREVRYDPAGQRREGECIMHADGGDTVLKYVVQWRDRDKSQYEVRVGP